MDHIGAFGIFPKHLHSEAGLVPFVHRASRAAASPGPPCKGIWGNEPQPGTQVRGQARAREGVGPSLALALAPHPGA